MSFGYLRDRLFLTSCACYAINRWILKPRVDSGFLRNWFNDLLLVPCAIPVVFWLFRTFHLRDHDHPPSLWDLASILVIWSLLFEWVGPRLVPHATGDWRDVLMYWTGGVLAWAFWHHAPPANGHAA